MADLKYLDSWIDDSIKDMKTRKVQVWVTYSKLGKIWKYILFRELYVKTKSTEKQNDGTYTRMLRTALKVSWRDHITNEGLY